MNPEYRVAHMPGYLEDPDVRRDFQRRTRKMEAVMKKWEREISKLICKGLHEMSREHKRLFSKDERGLVSIPDFLGVLTWPDHKSTVIRSSLYQNGMYGCMNV